MTAPLIKLNPDQLHILSDRLKSAANDTQSHALQLDRAYNSIDWSFAARVIMNTRVIMADRQRHHLQDELDRMSAYVHNVAIKMEEADRKVPIAQLDRIQPSLWFPSILSIISPWPSIGLMTVPILTGLAWVRDLINGGTAGDAASPVKNIVVTSEASDVFLDDIHNQVDKRLSDFNSNFYDGKGTRFPRIYHDKDGNLVSLEGQCTWYCAGRAQEKCNKVISIDGSFGSGDAAKWLDNVNNCRTSRDPHAIEVNSIAVSKHPSPQGHVVFIEALVGDNVYFSEANWPRDDKISPDDGIIKTLNINDFLRERKIEGYVYLND